MSQVNYAAHMAFFPTAAYSKNRDIDLAMLRLEENEKGISVLKADVDEAAHRLLLKAGQDSSSWDAACELAARLIAANRPLPEALGDFASKILRGQIKRPTKQKKPPNEARQEAEYVGFMVEQLVQRFGLKPTSEIEPSAIQVLAEALREAKIGQLGQDKIRVIWKARRRTQKGYGSPP